MSRVRPKGSDKAEKILGLNKDVAALSTVTVQIQGLILLKENSGKTKKRFCVVKDGFLIWYDKAPAESRENRLSFEKKPSGLFPLNRALVELSESGTEIFLNHGDIPRSELILVPELQDVEEWFEKLRDGTKATWDNAKVGIADLDNLRAKGTKLEKEKADALKLLQDKMRELDIANKKKAELLERNRQQNEKFQMQYGKAVEQLESKKSKIEELKEKAAAEDEEIKILNEKNQSLEKKLEKAHNALQKLDKDLQKYFGHTLTKKRGSSSLAAQMSSLGSPTIKASAQKAIQEAIVQSSPDIRSRENMPLVSQMSLPPVTKPARPLLTQSVKPKISKVSREAVAASVRAIKVFIDQHRNSSEHDSEEEGEL